MPIFLTNMLLLTVFFVYKIYLYRLMSSSYCCWRHSQWEIHGIKACKQTHGNAPCITIIGEICSDRPDENNNSFVLG